MFYVYLFLLIGAQSFITVFGVFAPCRPGPSALWTSSALLSEERVVCVDYDVCLESFLESITAVGLSLCLIVCAARRNFVAKLETMISLKCLSQARQ